MSLNKRAVATTFAIILVASLASLAFHLNLGASSSVITVPDQYTSIQAAINAAHDGDTVLVRAGQYIGNITVDKPLNLVGEDRQTTIIDENLSTTIPPLTPPIIFVEANDVNISGFTIQNSQNRYRLSDLIHLALGGPAGGIGLNGSVGCTIRNNTFQSCFAGVTICNSAGNTTVSDNTFNTGTGTYFGVVSITLAGTRVGGNTITGNNISSGTGILTTTPNNEISGNQLNCFAGGVGIQLSGNYSRSNIVSDNTINGTTGVLVEKESDNNLISNNTISAGGLTLNGCSNNTLRDNNVSSFGVEGSELSHFLNDIDTSNTINGRPIYYLVNQSNLVINPFTYPDIGYLGLVNSSNMNVWRLTIANNIQGLMLAQTTNSIIDEVSVSNNYLQGIYLWNCRNCTIMGSTITSSSTGIHMDLCNNSTIRGNTIVGNGVGLSLAGSGNNTFYRNNFIANGQNVALADQLPNEWDDRYSIYPLGWERRPVGNYWDTYTGQDDGTQTHGLINYAGDGVGDTLLPHEGVDNYPLMKPWIPVLGDLDYNGIVGLSDLVMLAQHYGQHYP